MEAKPVCTLGTGANLLVQVDVPGVAEPCGHIRPGHVLECTLRMKSLAETLLSARVPVAGWSHHVFVHSFSLALDRIEPAPHHVFSAVRPD